SADRRAVARRAAAAPRRAQRAGRRGTPLMRPLDGIRVLDFTWVVAGPVTTRILADIGADVIKVERRGSLDFGDRRGGLSGTLMRGKRSILLDLNDARGLDLARRLAGGLRVLVLGPGGGEPGRARRARHHLAPAADGARAARRSGAAGDGGERSRPGAARPRRARRRVGAGRERVAGGARRPARGL